jgi:hypothetical protein
VFTDFEMLNLVEQRETEIFQDGLFLGVGLPTVMSSALELIREVKGTQKATGIDQTKNSERRTKSDANVKKSRL